MHLPAQLVISANITLVACSMEAEVTMILHSALSVNQRLVAIATAHPLPAPVQPLMSISHKFPQKKLRMMSS